MSSSTTNNGNAPSSGSGGSSLISKAKNFIRRTTQALKVRVNSNNQSNTGSPAGNPPSSEFEKYRKDLIDTINSSEVGLGDPIKKELVDKIQGRNPEAALTAIQEVKKPLNDKRAAYKATTEYANFKQALTTLEDSKSKLAQAEANMGRHNGLSKWFNLSFYQDRKALKSASEAHELATKTHDRALLNANNTQAAQDYLPQRITRGKLSEAAKPYTESIESFVEVKDALKPGVVTEEGKGMLKAAAGTTRKWAWKATKWGLGIGAVAGGATLLYQAFKPSDRSSREEGMSQEMRDRMAENEAKIAALQSMTPPPQPMPQPVMMMAAPQAALPQSPYGQQVVVMQPPATNQAMPQIASGAQYQGMALGALPQQPQMA